MPDWAYRFAAAGYPVWLPDWPLIDRVVAVAPGPPGNIQPEATVIEETEDDVVVESFGMTRRLSRDR